MKSPQYNQYQLKTILYLFFIKLQVSIALFFAHGDFKVCFAH